MARSATFISASLIAILAISGHSFADERETLLDHVFAWRYPGAKIHGASVSDAATVNEEGKRTVPSVVRKTVMTTDDPIAKVVEYYKSKLKPDAEADTANSKAKPAPEAGRSVTFHNDSKGRPVAIHIILVNTNQTSTTLVISRAETETETHIAWTQYEKVQLDE